MSNPLRVIIVEDSEDDTLLILRELRRGGYTIAHKQVSTDAELSHALTQQDWDLVIADYSLPNFSAPAALQSLQAHNLDIPFIVISGNIPEDVAVALMKAGAHDYLMKYNLVRLVPVVERELREAQERRQRYQAEQSLQENEERFRTLIENALDIIVVLDLDGTLQYVSPSIERILGYRPTDSIGKNAFNSIHPDDRATVQEVFQTIAQTSNQISTTELRFKHQDDSWCILEAVCKRFVESDHIVRVVVNARDVSERKRIEDERKRAEAELQQLNQALDLKVQERTQDLERSESLLREREQSFRALAENTPDIVARFDRNLRHLYVSPSVQLVTGLSTDRFIGKTNQELGMPAHLVKNWDECLQTVFTTGQPTQIEFSLQTVDGIRHYQSKLVPEFALDGSIRSILTTARDITALKQAAIQQSTLSERLQTELQERQKIEDQLRASLQEKEILLREVHHRVKNNLQLVSSLLNLQANIIDNPELLKPFTESQQRVKTMALIHEKLYQSDNLAKINFAEYVQALMEDLFQSHQSHTPTISFCLKVTPVELPVDVVIPCGLIINELVSNSLKYAFPGKTAGEIKILFAPANQQQYTLIVSDNGIGMPDSIDFCQSSSLGLQLVCTLTQKLRGTIELDRTNGTAFNITF